ncbi:hypothetical protein LP416_02265 [Polaromonas sp. P2-4]|nr:hypothetical protein LP416_02265 [Polaromonas sp. P2-4]
MNEDKRQDAKKATIPCGIGALAARKRQQLERFDEERRRADERARLERDQLLKDAKEAEMRAHRKQRNLEQTEQKKLKFVLGGLVLTALRTRGPAHFTVSSQDLTRLDEKERETLDRVLAAMHAAAAKSAKGRKTKGREPDDGVDVVL